MKRYLILLLLLIPGLCFGAEAVKTAGGVADSAVKSISGKASADIKTMCGVGYNDGDGGCSASYGAETATGSNATDDAGGSETDATTGWTNSNSNTFDSIDTAPQTGTYHLTAVAADNLDGFYRSISGTGGTLYKLSYYIRHNGSGGDWRCAITPTSAAAVTQYPFALLTSSDTTYAQQTVYWMPNANADILRCGEASASNDGGIYLDNFSITTATLCYGDELYTASNALGSADANATTGITDATMATFEVASSGCADGTYCIHAVANSSNDAFYIDLSGILTDGHKYLVSWKGKHSGSGDTAACGFESSTSFSFVGSDLSFQLTASDTTWLQYGVSITYSSSYRYFGCVENGSSNNSDFYIDSLTIKEITGE